MRIKESILFLFLLGGFLLHGHAQDVTFVVTTTDGTEHSYQLTNEGQLYFENGERLVIIDKDGVTTSHPLADIQKLACTELTNVNENDLSALQILPNPLHNRFTIKNLHRSCEARVYALDGRLMKSFEAYEGMMVDISELAKGMYLLHLDGQTLKMMKL